MAKPTQTREVVSKIPDEERADLLEKAVAQMELALANLDLLQLHAAAAHLSMAIESARKQINPDRT